MKLERSIPAPVPDDANERAHRVDAETTAWMKERAAIYARSIEAVLMDDHSPAPWHEAEIRQHWPELWTLWNQYRQARQRLLKHVDNARKMYGG
jgi:hypothetical protein